MIINYYILSTYIESTSNQPKADKAYNETTNNRSQSRSQPSFQIDTITQTRKESKTNLQVRNDTTKRLYIFCE